MTGHFGKQTPATMHKGPFNIGTGILTTGPAVTFDLWARGATCFYETSAYGATAYF